MKIAVVGGGLTGLSAAFQLSRTHEVWVFEGRHTLGGLARGVQVGNDYLDCYYHHIFTHDQVFLDYIKTLGLEASMEWYPSSVATFYQDALYPFMGPLDLLRFPHLTLAQRIRFGLATLFSRELKNHHSLEHRTAKEWASGMFGPKGFEVIWEPLLRKKFEDCTPDIAAVWLWGKIALRGSSREKGKEKELLGYMQGSFQKFTDALSLQCQKQGAKVLSNAKVVALSRENAHWNVHLEDKVEGKFDQVLLTVSPRESFRLAHPFLATDEQACLQNLRFQGVLVATLLMDHPLTEYYWININDYGIPFGGLIEHTNMIAPSRYGGHIVYLSRYISTEDPLFQASDQEVLALFYPHLAKFNPGFAKDWVRQAWVYRDSYAQPVVDRGYCDRLPPLQSSAEGLFLATMNHIYPEDRGINYALRLGDKVAALMSKSPSAVVGIMPEDERVSLKL